MSVGTARELDRQLDRGTLVLDAHEIIGKPAPSGCMRPLPLEHGSSRFSCTGNEGKTLEQIEAHFERENIRGHYERNLFTPK